MTRIPIDHRPRGLTGRLIAFFSRRRYGRMLEPVAAVSHHPGALSTMAVYELMIERRLRRLDPALRELAVLHTASRVGCSWCVDFGSWLGRGHGLTEAKIRDVAGWRDSDAYTDLEKMVLGYAEAMTETPPTVTDEQVAALRRHLDDAQLVELTTMVAVENQRSRINAALGLRSQGFSDTCAVPGAGAEGATRRESVPARDPGAA
jgi:AhpD family alkylhydroperoxidase